MEPFDYTGVQGRNNAYHNVNKVQNPFIDALILNLIDIVVCVVFALYSSLPKEKIKLLVDTKSVLWADIFAFISNWIRDYLYNWLTLPKHNKLTFLEARARDSQKARAFFHLYWENLELNLTVDPKWVNFMHLLPNHLSIKAPTAKYLFIISILLK
jgi:hypothetical protein